jgi:hypothetical protein
MTEQLVEPLTAELAHQKGFNIRCREACKLTEKGPDYWRPTQDLLERWLREVHGLMPGQAPAMQGNKIVGFRAAVIPMNNVDVNQRLDATEYKTFELAREAAIVHALKLLPDVQTK